MPIRLIPLLALIACLAAPLAARAEGVLVFAAASAKTALDAVLEGFTEETGIAARASYAGSSALARQIGQGAPADLFLSANTEWMDEVAARGLIVPGTRRDLLGNRLVMVATAPHAPVEIGPALDLPALLEGGRLAVALVDAVPAGLYARQALESLGLWEGVADSLAQADNVRAALAYVARGEAPLGIVYASDAVAEKRVAVIGTFPEGSHAPIVYPVAALATGRAAQADTQALLAWLDGPAARAAFAAQGFTAP